MSGIEIGPRHIDGLSLRVADSGVGDPDRDRDPIVLIHSLGGHLDHWAASLAHFATRGRVLALDLPGHGLSDKPAEFPYSVAAFAHAVERTLEDAGIERAIWIGNSIGGHVALYQAVTGAARVAGLVLANATGANLGFEVDRLLTNPRAVLAPDQPAGERSLLPMLLSDPSGPTARQLVARQLEEMMRDDFPDRMRAVLRAARSIQATPLLDRLAEVAAPTLIVWGEDDRLLPRANASALASIRGARLTWLPGSGHLSPLETPEPFHRAVDEFLAARGSEAA